MTQEDKNLLIKDICSRLPYGVKVSCLGDFNHDWYSLELVDITDNEVYISTCEPYYSNKFTAIENIRPYFLPLSSITEEQKNQLKEIWGADMDKAIDYSISGEERLSGLCELSAAKEVIDWLIANHFDYRGLIEKGLAIDCTNLNIY